MRKHKAMVKLLDDMLEKIQHEKFYISQHCSMDLNDPLELRRRVIHKRQHQIKRWLDGLETGALSPDDVLIEKLTNDR